jgi:hypothetical protein
VKINQVNFSFVPLEDRLLFRFNTLNKTEFRMWLTRAMSIKLLNQLHQVVKVNLLREQPDLGMINLDTLGEFRREAVLAKADFVQSFSSGAEIFPLGSQPILVTDIIMDSSRPVSVVTFSLVTGREVMLSLNHDLGVAISKLLSDVTDGLDWALGMSKELPRTIVGGCGEKMMLH